MKVYESVHAVCDKGPYTKYAGVGDRRVFEGVMKYFKHILMGYEIFLKIFDGLQNIFLSSFLILTFSKFIWKVKWVWAENVQTSHQEDLRKIMHNKQPTKSFKLHDN